MFFRLGGLWPPKIFISQSSRLIALFVCPGGRLASGERARRARDEQLETTAIMDRDTGQRREQRSTKTLGGRAMEITKPNWPAPRPPQRKRKQAVRRLNIVELPTGKRIFWDPKTK